ncbi:hypothetical protein M407DRAFT_246534 [Tulasnella calospora MUT 4182]|uniref:Uncharacterized protein n=1 Tax=Tulasnella calospora MUT 4182 TaxID=1051891 RepID=A0A0C3Q4J5_9AGAM|nr:hypothetical protein M407DRAFT_246534 [Tulasnella calospora MUT 4182]
MSYSANFIPTQQISYRERDTVEAKFVRKCYTGSPPVKTGVGRPLVHMLQLCGNAGRLSPSNQIPIHNPPTTSFKGLITPSFAAPFVSSPLHRMGGINHVRAYPSL